jgi:hypothetical protein
VFLAFCGIAQLFPGYLIFTYRLLSLDVGFGYFVTSIGRE